MSKAVANSDIFQVVADPTRRAILDQLRYGEQTVKQIAEPFDSAKIRPAEALSAQSSTASASLRSGGSLRAFLANETGGPW